MRLEEKNGARSEEGRGEHREQRSRRSIKRLPREQEGDERAWAQGFTTAAEARRVQPFGCWPGPGRVARTSFVLLARLNSDGESELGGKGSS